MPNTTQEKIDLIRLEIERQAQENKLLEAQIEVNKVEAASDNWFVSGWRPAVGWICVLSFAWQFLALPILLFINVQFGHIIPTPSFDMATMATVLMGMLGIGGLRTYEKVKGI